jgi:hypothetical protein
MKILFAGSSLHGSEIDLTGLEVRPPAVQGDVLTAVQQGATAIGLVDGEFGQHAAVRHKEILFALSEGVAVFGSSSMGALRAAECACFGMIPIGTIARSYLEGRLDDDAAVALLMLPAELGSAPISEPLVDVDATLHRLIIKGSITPRQYDRLWRRAQRLHFTERTDEAIFAEEDKASDFLANYRAFHISLKRLDAELLVRTMQAFDPSIERAPANFALADSPFWKDAFQAARAAVR